ncbi:MAG: thiamine phosphate synthase [Alphaproteobacteria bacterium]|nr:thiamine phosphate synthase [Alphaproteobacteria bacterium]
MPPAAGPGCRLYLITPPALEPRAFGDTLQRALDGGDVACVQLRLKGPDGAAPPAPDDVRRATERLMPLVQARDAAFVLNDDPAIAAEMGADGVHVGQTDTPYAEARHLVGAGRIVGVTCHDSRHLAMEAGEAGANYVAFGAFFPTGTKQAKTRARPELIAWWAETFEVPCVAIGGITAENCAPLVAAGADFLAVAAGVWAHPDGPGGGVAAFARAIAVAREAG